MPDITEDYIFDGEIKLLQPRNGYRAAQDPVVLARQVELRPGQSILDVGCGVGTISLILKHLNRSQDITCIDIDPEMIDLCKKNSQINKLPLNITEGSINSPVLSDKNFDCVVTNPPFYNIHNFRASTTKKIANFETVDLQVWLKFCLKRLKSQGNLYIIHLPERVNEILDAVRLYVGKIEVTPLYSHPDRQAKRVIVKMRKGSREALKIMPPIFLWK